MNKRKFELNVCYPLSVFLNLLTMFSVMGVLTVVGGTPARMAWGTWGDDENIKADWDVCGSAYLDPAGYVMDMLNVINHLVLVNLPGIGRLLKIYVSKRAVTFKFELQTIQFLMRWVCA